MGYPLGLAPKSDGTGTTPTDVQGFLWGLYGVTEGGIIGGLDVQPTAEMSYKVLAGQVYLQTNKARTGVVINVETVTVPTDPAPSSGSRTDVIYVDMSGAVKVARSLPAGAVELDQRTVPAGVTATTGTTSTADRKFAMLRGASRGRLYKWKDGTAHKAAFNGKDRTVCTKRIWCPTDRTVDLRLTQTMFRDERDTTSSVLWTIWVDGTRLTTFEFEVTRTYETKQATISTELPQGAHTITLKSKQQVGNYPVHLANGGDGSWPGNTFEIIDLGVTI